MRTTPTARAYLFASIGFAGVAGGIAMSSPELVAIGAPFLVLLTVGLAAPRPARLSVDAPTDMLRVLEGEAVELEIQVNADRPLSRLELSLGLPPSAAVVEVNSPHRITGRDSIELAAAPALVECTVSVDRWGMYELDSITAFTMGPFSVLRDEVQARSRLLLKVFPHDETARRLLEPVETQLAYGDLVARQRGEGIEYADLRVMQLGDDPRHINWRASARSKAMWVNDRHPERNSDVVLFIDALPGARRGVEPTLDLGIRAIAGLARMHLRRHDRVGLITFGEPVRWLQPGMGSRKRYQILDMLMAARMSRHLYWRGISAVPPRALPSKALVVAVTPLLDDRVVGAIADLHGRGFDVAVIEVDAVPFLPPPEDEVQRVARRVWRLRRSEVRDQFTRHGVAVARWQPEEPFEHPLLEVEAFRRQQARTRV